MKKRVIEGREKDVEDARGSERRKGNKWIKKEREE